MCGLRSWYLICAAAKSLIAALTLWIDTVLCSAQTSLVRKMYFRDCYFKKKSVQIPKYELGYS